MARATGTSPLFFPCNMGMHQEFGKNGAPPGTIYSCTNSRLDASGCLIKRGGHVALTATTVSSTAKIAGDGTTYVVEKPRFLATIAGQSVVGLTSGDVFSRNDAAGQFVFQGRHSTAQPIRKRKGLVGDDISQTTFAFNGQMPASAVSSDGYVLFACCTAAGNAISVLEAADGTRLRVDNFGSIDKVQALAVGATLYLITQAGTDVRARTVGPSGVGSSVTVATLSSSAHHWDTSAYTASLWLLVSQTGAGTMTWEVMSGTATVRTTTFSVTGTCPVSIFGENYGSGNIWIGWYNDPTVTGDVNYRVYASNGSVVLGETTITSVADIYGPPLFGRFYNYSSPTQTSATFYVFRQITAGGNRHIRTGTAYSDGTTVTAPAQLTGCIPISKPDNFNRVWVLLSHAADDTVLGQSRVLLLRWNTVAAGANQTPVIELASPIMPWLGTTNSPEASADRFHAMARTSTRSYFAFPFALVMRDEGPLIKTEVYEYTVSDQAQHVETEPLDVTTAIAGQPAEAFAFPADSIAPFQSGGIVEIGFAARPVIVSATQVSGSALAAGTYSYVAVFDWVDQNGRRHRSAPSLPKSVTTTALANIEVVVAPFELSPRQYTNSVSAINLELYRTVNGGTSWQRLPDTFSVSAGATITDDTPDAVLADNEFVYTDGGVLPNTLAPSCRFMAYSEDRLWCGGLWDGSIIECSKIIVPGEPIQFTGAQEFQVKLPSECTGLAYMDGSVVAFLENDICLISGDGPNDQGAGPFPPPRFLGGPGCVDHRSILKTKVGIFYQSRRGIELLPRGFGGSEYVGRAVKDVLQIDGLNEIIGATERVDDKHHTVRFLVKAPGDASTDQVIVYDLDRGEWFQDTLFQQCSALGSWPDGPVYASATFDSDDFTHPFLYENGSQTGDGPVGDTDYVSQQITFCRLYPFGSAVGWGTVSTVNPVLESRDTTAATYTVSVQIDQTAVQTPATGWTIAPGAVGEQYWKEYSVPNRQCSGITIILADTQSPSVAGAGVKWIGVGVVAQTDGGVRPANANNDERR